MKLLELFSGQGSISKAFRNKGWEIYRVDYNQKLEAELHSDISELSIKDILKLCNGVPDVIWASPDCTTYSIATHLHRTSKTNFEPQTEYGKVCDDTNYHLYSLIDKLVKLGTKVYFVENPRGRYRHMKFTDKRPRYTITYCSYGSISMKPTDIFTNHPSPSFLPECTTSNPPHKHANWSTDIKRDYLSRGAMPKELCYHIEQICNQLIKGE